jgi:uncharacterized protein (DUF433 family)
MMADVVSTLVATDPEIMGGKPVFAGSRLPIDTVLASLASGIPLARLQASFPFLTEAHIRAAQAYPCLQTHAQATTIFRGEPGARSPG